MNNIRIKKIDKFTVEISDDEKRWAFHRDRIPFYIDGLKHRSKSVFTSYKLDLISFQENDIVFDIGANTGDLKLYFDLAPMHVQYFAFEPATFEFKCLKYNLPNEENLFQLAISNFNGATNLFINPGIASSSIIEPPCYLRIDQVAAVKLDNYENQSVIKLIKIDAEGAEPEVLEGATNLLKKTEFVAIDVGKERGVMEEDTEKDCLRIMIENNFQLFARSQSHRHTLLFRNLSFIEQN